jgi:hypothetical protein
VIRHCVSNFVQPEIRERESVSQRRVSVSGFVGMNWIVPEEGADRVSFSFSNQSLEALGVHTDRTAVKERPRTVQVTIHDSVSHGRSKSVLRDAYLPRPEVLTSPVGAFEVVLPCRVARQILYGAILEAS